MASFGRDKVVATAHKIASKLQEADADFMNEFSKIDSRLRDFQGNSSKVSRQLSAMDHDSNLDDMAAILIPWIGAVDSKKHLWESHRRDIDAFLTAAEKVHSTLETIQSSKVGGKTVQKAVELMKLVTQRLEDELGHMLRTHSKPMDPQRAEIEASAKPLEPWPSSGIVGIVKLHLLPESVLPSLNEIVAWLVNFRKEDVVRKTFRAERAPVVEKSLVRLGMTFMSPDELVKLAWQSLDDKIEKWVQTVGIAIRVIFASERSLCDLVFSVPRLAEDCFLESVESSISSIFRFSEAIATGKRSPEKLFRVLEMFEVMRGLQAIFNHIFTGDVSEPMRREYVMCMVRLSEASRDTFAEVENAIERDSTKVPHGGAVHGLTSYVMNFFKLLSDYGTTLTELFTKPILAKGSEPPDMDEQYTVEGEKALTEEEVKLPENSPLGASIRWKIQVLIRNLEGKAKQYRDPALGQLFLMNNLHYIANKVKHTDLRPLCGSAWLMQQAELVRKYAKAYQEQSWGKLLHCLREEVPAGKDGSVSRPALKERFRQCNLLLEELHALHTTWLVQDPALKAELKAALVERVLNSYCAFRAKYARYLEAGRHPTKYIKYAPSGVETLINDLFKSPS